MEGKGGAVAPSPDACPPSPPVSPPALQSAIDTLNDPDSLHVLRRGWMLRGFLMALWVSNVWFQHTYLSIFTK